MPIGPKGTAIYLFGAHNVNGGSGVVTVDGIPAGNFSTYVATNGGVDCLGLWFAQTGLVGEGMHSVTVRVTGGGEDPYIPPSMLQGYRFGYLQYTALDAVVSPAPASTVNVRLGGSAGLSVAVGSASISTGSSTPAYPSTLPSPPANSSSMPNKQMLSFPAIGAGIGIAVSVISLCVFMLYSRRRKRRQNTKTHTIDLNGEHLGMYIPEHDTGHRIQRFDGLSRGSSGECRPFGSERTTPAMAASQAADEDPEFPPGLPILPPTQRFPQEKYPPHAHAEAVQPPRLTPSHSRRVRRAESPQRLGPLPETVELEELSDRDIERLVERLQTRLERGRGRQDESEAPPPQYTPRVEGESHVYNVHL